MKTGAVSLGQLPSQVGSKRPFDMDVQLDFGECRDEVMVVCQQLRPQFPAALRCSCIRRLGHGLGDEGTFYVYECVDAEETQK